MITTTVEAEFDLAIFTCTETVTREDLEHAIEQFYGESQPARMALWDLTGADLSALSPTDIRDVAALVKRQWHSRAGGRTAIVGRDDLAYGLGRMYEMTTDFPPEQLTIRVFRSIEDARGWLTRTA